MKGYWNKTNATQESIIDDWFYTGDAGYFDNEKFLYIHDRVKDMIVSGGENVYPAEVENALMAHENITDAAVIGIPDNKWGETVKGIVVVNEKISDKEIIDFVKSIKYFEDLSDFGITFHDESMNLEILKRDLEEELLALSDAHYSKYFKDPLEQKKA